MSTLQQEGLRTLVDNINKEINKKVNGVKVDAYTRTEVDSFLQTIDNEYIDGLFNIDGDTSDPGTGGGTQIDAYTKEESDAKYATKIDVTNNIYTKTESDNKYIEKADADNKYFLKTEAETIKTDLTSAKETITSHTSSISGLNNEVTNLKSSVSNGKSLIASAITDKGISTSNDATFETMANNVKNINGVLQCRPGDKNTLASLYPISSNGQFLAYQGVATYKGGVRFSATFADYKERNRTVYIYVIIPSRNIDEKVKKSGSDYMMTCTYDTDLVIEPGDFIRILAGYEGSISTDTGMACSVELSCDF